ncbi:hypothetical protein JNMOADIG_00025 [Aeromonas phage avDM5]|uniref:Uncharacterized protein n=1 Tax=Aeromonas phage vB_AehM_DM2 TaxID=2973716 RepID=A0AA95C424_9CAUD|nr:hypothetical protein JNMOADIG_00025 [Aeromonas phage avDM5]UYD60472.1 hypothetical protein NPHMPGLK_00137 [Aeromonas phage avDM2]UYD60692.1 hypothetical protein NHNEHLNL_00096 [Aeromonas phage avDM2]
MLYRFVSEEQFNAWSSQNYAKEFAKHFRKWDDVFATEDLSCEGMTDWAEINGQYICSSYWYPFVSDDLGSRLVEVEEVVKETE